LVRGDNVAGQAERTNQPASDWRADDATSRAQAQIFVSKIPGSRKLIPGDAT